MSYKIYNSACEIIGYLYKEKLNINLKFYKTNKIQFAKWTFKNIRITKLRIFSKYRIIQY